MKWTKMIPASCLAAALSTMSAATSVQAQEEPVEIRVRAVAGPDGKVQVVEERVIGAEKEAEKTEKKEAGKSEEQPLRARIIRRVQELGEKVGGVKDGNILEVITEDFWGDMPPSDYWIGVQIAPVAPEIRKHLPVKHGVLVQHVFPDSPATKADLKADDILLQAGDKKIETGPDLVKAVDAAKTTELSFIVLREGKELKLNITAMKRDEGAQHALTRTAPAPRLEKLQAAQKQFEKALEALRAETQQGAAVDFMLVRPGAFMAYGTDAKVPDDLAVQITKEGNKPAKIHVKQGEKSWDVTGDKLDALPKEIRPHVERMLHTPGFTWATDKLPQTFSMKLAQPAPGVSVPVPAPPRFVPGSAAIPAVPGIPATPPVVARAATAWTQAFSPPATDAKLDQILKKLDTLSSPDLEEMKKELKALRKEVDELRKKTGEEKSSPRER